MLACPRKAEAKSLLQQEQKTFYTRNPDYTGDGSPYHGYVVKRAEDPDQAVSHMSTAGEGRFEVLLDTQATCHLIRDRALLRSVEELANPVRFDGIGGSSRVRYSGYMPYFGRVYHDPSAPVTILALSVVEDAYSVEYEPRSYLGDIDITAEDVYRANAIYGNEIAVIKGKHKERKEKPLPDRYEAARYLPV